KGQQAIHRSRRPKRGGARKQPCVRQQNGGVLLQQVARNGAGRGEVEQTAGGQLEVELVAASAAAEAFECARNEQPVRQNPSAHLIAALRLLERCAGHAGGVLLEAVRV